MESFRFFLSNRHGHFFLAHSLRLITNKLDHFLNGLLQFVFIDGLDQISDCSVLQRILSIGKVAISADKKRTFIFRFVSWISRMISMPVYPGMLISLIIKSGFGRIYHLPQFFSVICLADDFESKFVPL